MKLENQPKRLENKKYKKQDVSEKKIKYTPNYKIKNIKEINIGPSKTKKTFILKNIPTLLDCKYVSKELTHLFSFYNLYPKINILKKNNYENKGIAFIDFHNLDEFNYVLELSKTQKFSIDNSILHFEIKS